MDNQQELQLINGRFTLAEAEHLLHDLAQVKTCHYVRRIVDRQGTEEDIKAAENRIKAIETDVRTLIAQLRSMAATGQMVDISGVVVIQPVG